MMIINPDKDVQREQMYPGASRMHYIDKATGSGSVSMGLLTLEPGGELPPHTHLVEDCMIVLEGNGILVVGDKEYEVHKGQALIAPANTRHTIRNRSDKPFTIVYAWPAHNVERFVVE